MIRIVDSIIHSKNYLMRISFTKKYICSLLSSAVFSHIWIQADDANAKRLAKAEDRNPPITALRLTLTVVRFSERSAVLQDCNWWFWATELGQRKKKLWGRLVGKYSYFKNSNQINIWLLNRGSIGILDYSFYEWIHCLLVTGTLDLPWLYCRTDCLTSLPSRRSVGLVTELEKRLLGKLIDM